jgi:hypothetical protein
MHQVRRVGVQKNCCDCAACKGKQHYPEFGYID